MAGKTISFPAISHFSCSTVDDAAVMQLFPQVLALAELFASIPAVMSEVNSLFFELPPTDQIAGVLSRIESSSFPRNLTQRNTSSRGYGTTIEPASRGSSLRSGGTGADCREPLCDR